MTHDDYTYHLAKAWNHARHMMEKCRGEGQLTLASNWKCDVDAIKGCLDAAEAEYEPSMVDLATGSVAMQ